MANILKCKMCGGDIEVSQDMTIGKCLFCGSTMTLPRIDSDKKARLFNRANEYRLNNEFDKAYDAYKTITEEDEQEAEAYWGMILSEYGVEYVEDPNSGKRIPTCHRTKIQSVRSSKNYQLALQYADSESKFIYQDEAEILDKLQRSILAISSQEEPYDVFICYKETDTDSGDRTKDSVLAQDIYQELEKNGIRTFFSRISLETHLGENYEPYIFSALQSARVMLVVSTSGDNCDSVWVKNEWSRFLNFMTEDKSKSIIPVYREMSPYEFPEELSNFQAQDMGKVGAIQDLVYGIKKVLGTTRTGTRDARIDALAFEVNAAKEEERKRKEKAKIIKKIILAVSILVVVAAIIILGIKVIIPKTNQAIASSKMENNKVTTNGTVPDADKYACWDLELNQESLNSNMDLISSKNLRDNDFLYYKSKLYEKGWIYMSTSNGLFDFSSGVDAKKGITNNFVISNKSGMDMDFFPRIFKLNKLNNRTSLKLSTSFVIDESEPMIYLHFVSKNLVKTYRIYKDGNTIKRYVELKNGQVFDNVIEEEYFATDDLLNYYY